MNDDHRDVHRKCMDYILEDSNHLCSLECEAYGAIYVAGEMHGQLGGRRADNPFRAGTRAWTEWHTGWAVYGN